MNETAEAGVAAFGPWAPGVESPVPERLRHLCTIFRSENSTTSWASARELGDLTGLEASDLAALRPQRLALHELLIRVTADYSVPDGPRIEDLGINFRRVVSRVLAQYVEPQMNAIVSSCDGIRRGLAAIIEAELTALARRPAQVARPAPGESLAARLARLAGAVVRETLLAGGSACRPLIARDGLSAVLIEPAIKEGRLPALK